MRSLLILVCYKLLEVAHYAWKLVEGGEGNEKMNFLCGPGSMIFYVGPYVRQTYGTPPEESIVHMLHMDIQEGEQKTGVFGLWYTTVGMLPVTWKTLLHFMQKLMRQFGCEFACVQSIKTENQQIFDFSLSVLKGSASSL